MGDLCCCILEHGAKTICVRSIKVLWFKVSSRGGDEMNSETTAMAMLVSRCRARPKLAAPEEAASVGLGAYVSSTQLQRAITITAIAPPNLIR
jgi:hypothetical protein